MTYGRIHCADHTQSLDGAVVSHSAELVRGNSIRGSEAPPHPAFGPFSPRGEGAHGSRGRSSTGRWSLQPDRYSAADRAWVRTMWRYSSMATHSSGLAMLVGVQP